MKKMIGATILTMLMLLVFPQVAVAGLATGVHPSGDACWCPVCGYVGPIPCVHGEEWCDCWELEYFPECPWEIYIEPGVE